MIPYDDRDSLVPLVTYYLARSERTSPQPLRKVNEMSTSLTEMEGDGLLIFLPDFDTLTDEAIRNAE